MLVLFKTEERTAWENKLGRMVKLTKECGLIITCMVRVSGPSPMEPKRREFGLMAIELNGWMMKIILYRQASLFPKEQCFIHPLVSLP